MKQWRQGESITAQKLNDMQVRPLMEGINISGVDGGLVSSALDNDTIEDIGTYGNAKAVQLHAHENSYTGKVDYNDDDNVWQIKRGITGVTGVVAHDAKCLSWAEPPSSDNQTLWQVVKTDRWGNVNCVSNTYCDASVELVTQMWNPASCQDGTIYRKLAHVHTDERFPLPDGMCETCAKWRWTQDNYDNALVLPVPRKVGWDVASVINPCATDDVKSRLNNSKWIPTVLPDIGATTPITGVGELGGIKAYAAKDNNGDPVGIGLAAGIEFYDKSTIANRNICETRPWSTTARVDFGSGGKHGFIQISNVNEFAPWQFELTGALDIGSLDIGSLDIGTDYWQCHINTLPYADGKVCAGYYYSWQGRNGDPQPDKRSGIMDGSVTRLQIAGGLACAQMCKTSSSVGWRVGEIQDGGVGIATATYMPMGCYDEASPLAGNVMWNPNGGVVTAIMADSNCRSYIDTDGIIHTPNPCWMGEEGVRCAHSALMSCLRGTMTPMYTWTPPYNDCTSWSCLHQGVVNGKIQSIKPDNITEFAARKPWGGEQIMYSEVGEIKCGRIGITTSWFDPTYCWWTSSAPDDVTECHSLHYAWQTSGGLIRGIMADIPLSLAKKQPPYIDDKGIIHIVYVDTDAWSCDFDKKITYKEPRYWDGNPPT